MGLSTPNTLLLIIVITLVNVMFSIEGSKYKTIVAGLLFILSMYIVLMEQKKLAKKL